MSIEKTLNIKCDSRVSPSCTVRFYDNGFPKKQLREHGRYAGWRRAKGKDICPNCAHWLDNLGKGES